MIDPVFTDAYRRARTSTAARLVAQAVPMAVEFRTTYRLDEQHTVVLDVPRWMWECLTEDDRLELANGHAILLTPRRRG